MVVIFLRINTVEPILDTLQPYLAFYSPQKNFLSSHNQIS